VGEASVGSLPDGLGERIYWSLTRKIDKSTLARFALRLSIACDGPTTTTIKRVNKTIAR
jgi:hypothetical protein